MQFLFQSAEYNLRSLWIILSVHHYFGMNGKQKTRKRKRRRKKSLYQRTVDGNEFFAEQRILAMLEPVLVERQNKNPQVNRSLNSIKCKI